MKKFKLFSIFCALTLLFTITAQPAFAATYFESEDYCFQRVNNDVSKIMICDYLGTDADVVVPSEIYGATVVSLDKLSFSGCDNADNITSITLPDTITSIDGFAFYKMQNLKSINIPKSCTDIEIGFCDGCSSLTDVDIQAPITSISSQMFNKCSSLTEFHVPSTVTEIGAFAFADCTSLAAVFIPESVTSIADNAFKNDSLLTIYGIPGSYAEQYAAENQIPFVDLYSLYDLGDVDMNGVVNIRDATSIQRYLVAYIELSDLQLHLADVNSDGKVDITDATAVQRSIAK